MEYIVTLLAVIGCIGLGLFVDKLLDIDLKTSHSEGIIHRLVWMMAGIAVSLCSKFF